MSAATLDGNRVTHARAQLPAWGAWWADVTLDSEVSLEGAVELAIGDLVLFGTIVSGGPAQGRSVFRVAAGAAGWGKLAPARAYANDAGVKLSQILADAAAVAGEQIDTSTVPDTRVGYVFAREEAPAGRVLQQLSPDAWYVGEDGVTRLGRRPAAELKVDAPRIEIDLARGVIVLAAEQVATVLPGITVDGLEAVDVLHEVTPKGFRSTIWGNGPSLAGRRLVALRRLIDQLIPEHRFRGVYAYRVISQEGERLNLQATRVSLGMPDLRRVRVMPGVAGCRADVALGSTVLVTFVDADPARAVVVGFEDAEGSGFAPSRLDLVGEDDAVLLAADAVGRAVRFGDTIMMPSGPGATPTPTVVQANPALPGPLSRVYP